jgi:hypothetical protein
MARFIARIKDIWSELDYAQRRLLEIRTGLPLGARDDSGLPRSGGGFGPPAAMS